jgi:hypothetical protein
MIARRRVVLSLCDATTNMVQPWADAGFLCFCVDVRHLRGTSKRGNSAERGNVRSVTPRGFARAVFKANFQTEQLDDQESPCPVKGL